MKSQFRPKNFSWSQAKKYSDCAKKYHYNKVLGLPEKPGVGLLIGIIADDVVMGESGYFADVINKIKNGPEYYEKKFEDKVKNLKNDAEDHLTDEENDQLEKDASRVQTLITQYCEPTCMMHRHLTPLAVQKKYNISLTGLKAPIIGFADLISRDKNTNELVVVDLKVTKQRPYMQIKSYKLQTALYAFAEMQEQKLDYIPNIEIHSMVKNKKPILDHGAYMISTDDITQTYQMLLNLQFGIDSNYYPLNRLSNLCTPTYCTFYDKCHSDHDRKLETLKLLYDKSNIKKEAYETK